ncbi:hypothetical protein U9M48_032048 [Paspalum notatum var. saurae]|uniref:BED-type domain-containing protein n=1 Tax=Paspalum notatum var. saurae TaxID=547442 RepID=A0AAQ3X519_PASNO
MATRSPQVTMPPMVTGSPMMRLFVSPVVMGARSPSPFMSPLLPQPTVERSVTPATSPPPSTSHDPGSRSAGNKPRKLRSEIWKDMDPIYHDGKVVEAKCKHCYEVFSATRNSGNSHMRRHLAVCEPRIKIHDVVDKLQSSAPSTESVVLANWKFDRKVTRAELVRMICLHEISFSLVEYDGFRRYSASLNPLAETVSRTTIKQNCIQAYKNHRSTLRDKFGGSSCRFSLTADLWTSNQNIGYMCVTCHYIDSDWNVQKI